MYTLAFTGVVPWRDYWANCRYLQRGDGGYVPLVWVETMVAPIRLGDDGCRLWVCTMGMGRDPYETMAAPR